MKPITIEVKKKNFKWTPGNWLDDRLEMKTVYIKNKLWDDIDELKFTCKTVRKKGEIIRQVECLWKGEIQCLIHKARTEEVLNAKRDYEMVKDGLKRNLLLREIYASKREKAIKRKIIEENIIPFKSFKEAFAEEVKK